MWRALSTEVEGWLEALRDRDVVGVLLLRALSAAFCAVVALTVVGMLGVWQAVLAPILVVLGSSLVALRARGRP